jgi:hypothetical protein
MALEGQIERAAMTDRPPGGFEYMNRDAILALPPGERAEAIAELRRARQCVLRLAGHDAAEILAALGLDAAPTNLYDFKEIAS